MRTYCTAQGPLLSALWRRTLNGKEIQKSGDVCTHIADSLCCTAETNTTSLSNYTPKKKNFFNRQYIELMDFSQDRPGLLNQTVN